MTAKDNVPVVAWEVSERGSTTNLLMTRNGPETVSDEDKVEYELAFHALVRQSDHLAALAAAQAEIKALREALLECDSLMDSANIGTSETTRQTILAALAPSVQRQEDV